MRTRTPRPARSHRPLLTGRARRNNGDQYTFNKHWPKNPRDEKGTITITDHPFNTVRGCEEIVVHYESAPGTLKADVNLVNKYGQQVMCGGLKERNPDPQFYKDWPYDREGNMAENRLKLEQARSNPASGRDTTAYLQFDGRSPNELDWSKALLPMSGRVNPETGATEYTMVFKFFDGTGDGTETSGCELHQADFTTDDPAAVAEIAEIMMDLGSNNVARHTAILDFLARAQEAKANPGRRGRYSYSSHRKSR